jgi:hypothetical protein
MNKINDIYNRFTYLLTFLVAILNTLHIHSISNCSMYRLQGFLIIEKKGYKVSL